MEFIVLDHAEAIAQKAADAIEELLASKPNAVLGTAVMDFEFNRNIINAAPCLMVLTTVNKRSGYKQNIFTTLSK